MIHQKTAVQLRASFQEGALGAQEIALSFLQRIDTLDTELHSLLSVTKERALKQAQVVDAKKKQGKPLGKLAGVPVIIKDNIQVRGERMTCASKFLEHYISPFDATTVCLLEAEDAMILGKANLDEFAMGSSNETSFYGPVKNPWNLECVPGGSSG